MIYLNGQIGAVYMNGRYHSEVYLGSVLVWSGIKKIPGEAHAQLAFENTADGVTALAVPAAAAAQLRLLSSAEGKATPFGVGQGDGALVFHTSAEGKAVLVEKNLISELLTLTSSGNAVPVDGGTSKAGEALTLTQNADGVGAAAVPDSGGEKLTVTQSGEGIAAGTVPAEGGGEVNFAGTGEGVSTAAESGAASEPLTLENSAAPAAATLGDGLAALGLHLVSRAEGRSYAVGWEYPVQDGDTLRVTQVYGALQESDGTLTLDAPVSGKVVKEQDGIAWIIPNGTINYDKTGTGDGWLVYADRNEVQYIVLENRNTQAVNVKMGGSANAYVTGDAAAADAHPRGHITVNGVTVATADGFAVTEGVWVSLGIDWGDFKNWQPNTQKVIGIHGGTYHGEYTSPPQYHEQTLLAIASIHATEGS